MGTLNLSLSSRTCNVGDTVTIFVDYSEVADPPGAGTMYFSDSGEPTDGTENFGTFVDGTVTEKNDSSFDYTATAVGAAYFAVGDDAGDDTIWTDGSRGVLVISVPAKPVIFTGAGRVQ